MADSILIDPLKRKIVLNDHTWFGHILKGHPSMRTERAKAEQAVRDPSEIQVSTYDADCRVYYGRPGKGGVMIAVVADVVVGLVKTAYEAAKKKTGSVEWPTP